MRARLAPAIGHVAWLATVTAALWGFGEVLPTPHTHSVRAVEAWYTEASGAVVLATVARLGTLLVSVVLLARTAARLAELVVVDNANRCIDRLAPGALSRLAGGMAGLSLTAGLTSVPSVSGGPTDGEPGIAALRDADEGGSGTATMRRVDEPTQSATAATPPPAAVPSSPPPPPPVAETVVVAHGDSFWSIAEEVVIDRGGSSDERSVTRYWQELVAANLANLIDPGNPDLIHPGQRLTLPAG